MQWYQWQVNEREYHCKMCVNDNPVQSGELKEISLGAGLQLECVEKLCYLGNMIGAGGEAEVASRA
jgi:hypothetical protein